jgi:hypothetical protein
VRTRLEAESDARKALSTGVSVTAQFTFGISTKCSIDSYGVRECKDTFGTFPMCDRRAGMGTHGSRAVCGPREKMVRC